MSTAKSQRKAIGKQLKAARKESGIKYKDIPMNYRTVKNLEEGTRTFEIDNLLEYMEELQLMSLTISIKDDGRD